MAGPVEGIMERTEYQDVKLASDVGKSTFAKFLVPVEGIMEKTKYQGVKSGGENIDPLQEETPSAQGLVLLTCLVTYLTGTLQPSPHGQRWERPPAIAEETSSSIGQLVDMPTTTLRYDPKGQVSRAYTGGGY
ncbi:hypothetical protein PG988_007455 [Apiospora saccharicola]